MVIASEKCVVVSKFCEEEDSWRIEDSDFGGGWYNL